MHLTPEAIESMAHGLLKRNLGADEVKEVHQRLAGLLNRVREMDQHRLVPHEPTSVFHPAHPAWSKASPEPLAWQGLGASQSSSSGYVPPEIDPTEGGESPYRLTETLPAPVAGAEAELLYMSAAEASERIRRKEISPVELTQAVLDRIKGLNPYLNSFITVTETEALAEARQAEAAVASGEQVGPLHGIPYAVKDLVFTRGVRSTAGSQVMEEWVPDEDATAVEGLRKAGAVMVGKAHTHEWAYGGTSLNDYFGPARNPWDPNRIPGGSSGGSAAAVAAGMAYAALGTDTAGSVRIPAAICGVVGLKPTYGRVSKAGVFPLSWSQDTLGFLTRTVADAALMLAALAGADPKDPTTVDHPVQDYVGFVRSGVSEGLKGVRIGLVRDWLESRIEEDVRAGVLNVARTLQDLGAEVRDVVMPPPDPLMVVNRLLTMAEATSFHTPYLQEKPDHYSDEVRMRLEAGQFLMARDYITGLRLRGELCQQVAKVMKDVDVLLAPVMPMRAPLIGQDAMDWNGDRDAVAEALIRLTSPFNVTGQPGIAIPSGFSQGLPIGVQLIGRPFEEGEILRVAAAYEAAVGGLSKRPPC